MNEINEVVENTAEETMNDLQKLNAKDIAITAGLGAVVVGAVVLVVKFVKGKKIHFKNPFAKKSAIENVVDEVTETIEDVVQA